MPQPRMYNLAGLRQAVFNQLDWSPSQDALAKERVDEMIDRAYMRLVQDAPFLFFEDEQRMGVHPDRGAASATDLLRVADGDAWVLETELLVGDPGALVWESDREWGARYLLLTIPNPVVTEPDEVHLIRIREVFFTQPPSRVRISLEQPWRNTTDTGIEFRVISDEFTLPDDVLEVRNLSLVEETSAYPYPLACIGQSQAEYATFPNNNRLQTAGPPRSYYRREHKTIPAPHHAPVTSVNPGGWVGSEATGTFEYLITYTWGRQEIWSHNPSPESQAALAPVSERYEPYFESGPSKVSNPTVVPVGGATSVDLTLPNIDFIEGFGDPATPRFNRSGFRKRIYRRRVATDDPLTSEVSNAFLLLDEVEGDVTTYTDDGTRTPDRRRPFRAVHGYQTFRLYPRPERRYELVLRTIRRPATLVDDNDVPRIHRDGIDCLLLRTLVYIYENQGNAAMAGYCTAEYDKALFQMSKRYGTLRPSNRPRRRRTGRVRDRYTWRRDLAGVVKNS